MVWLVDGFWYEQLCYSIWHNCTSDDLILGCMDIYICVDALVIGRSQVWSLKVGAGSWDIVPLGEKPETVHGN